MFKLFSRKKESNSGFRSRSEEELMNQAYTKIGDSAQNPLVGKTADSIDDFYPAQENINLYHDPEGLTVKKMGIGLWMVENRKNMTIVVYVFLILISVLTWPRFLYTFGEYIFKGMNDDRDMVNSLADNNILVHNFAIIRSAKPLVTQAVQVLESGEGLFDFIVQINNQNKEHWGKFDYQFLINGEIVTVGTNFILPAESKYILTLGIKSKQFPRNVEFKTDTVDWQRLNKHTYPDWNRFRHDHLNIIVDDVVFTPAGSTILAEKVSLNDLSFVIRNETAYNYWEVNFSILLYGANGIIGSNRYTAEKLMSGDVRKVSVTWPGRLSRVGDIVISPEINITEKDIYIGFEGETIERR